MMRILLIQFLLLIPSISFAQSQKVYIVLLGGQSNMAGRGQFEELSSINKTRVDNASKYVSIASGSKNITSLSFNSLTKRQSNFGPELFIGIQLHEQFPNREFLLIKEAQGGTSLYGAWNPQWTMEKALIGEIDAKRQNMKLYSKHIQVIKDLLEQLEAKGKEPVLMGMCWMQGEKDSRLEVTASEYGNNLKLFIQSYRQTLKEKNLPFVFGQINCPPRSKFPKGTEVVRQQMSNIEKQIHHTYMIPTTMDSTWQDFPKQDDNVHYNTKGQEKLGTAFGKSLIQNSTI
ncbi:sialate O-acetylesterase [Flammeovirga sp. SJP92]|uniref:sialate O-acetylesterase n=1 Tax=Flammeovirga sp. SJP92 TaxID=1775430 RepID=UPI000787013C|nr:sialate O-acetylesterase [Flammeovirga sp. SJP92]KXX66851.1 hypothetical protein AVL50_30430 [Flammeovirga sp. SJP92]